MKTPEAANRRICNKYLLLTIVMLMHICRNISTPVYFGLIAISYFLLISEIIRVKQRIIIRNLLELIFLLTYSIIPLTTLFSDLSEKDLVNSIGRYAIIYLYFLFTMFARNCFDDKFKRQIETIYIYSIVIASLSLYWQLIFGPIKFLADSSVRSGLERYATTAGSLTSFGGVGPEAVLILLQEEELMKGWKRYTALCIISIACIISLSKAAIINLIVAIGMYIVLNNSKKESLIINIVSKAGTIIVIIILIGLITNYLEGTKLSSYVKTGMDYTLSGDRLTSNTDDLYARLWKLPMEVVEYNKIRPYNLILGIGLKAMGGVMGLQGIPQPHNTILGMVFTGGIFFALSYCLLLIEAAFDFKNRLRSCIIILLIINMIAGGGGFWSPYGAVVVFFFLFGYQDGKL